MENIAEALEMAGHVLIFIVALSVCISSFTILRQQMDDTVNQTETINLVKGSERIY